MGRRGRCAGRRLRDLRGKDRWCEIGKESIWNDISTLNAATIVRCSNVDIFWAWKYPRDISADLRVGRSRKYLPINPELDAARASAKQGLEYHCKGCLPPMHSSIKKAYSWGDEPSHVSRAILMVSIYLTSKDTSRSTTSTSLPCRIGR